MKQNMRRINLEAITTMVIAIEKRKLFTFGCLSTKFTFASRLYKILPNILFLITLYLYNKRHATIYITFFFMSTNLLFMCIQCNPELAREFLANYTTLMEGSSNNGGNPGSNPGEYEAGPGFEPQPQGNADKTVVDPSTKRKHSDSSEQDENWHKRTHTASTNTTGQPKELTKLQSKFSKNDTINNIDQIESKTFPDKERDIVLYSDDLKGNITEVAIDDKGKLKEAFYSLEDKEGACDCCGNVGIKNCKCGGPNDPKFSVPMHPPAPRRPLTRPFCKDTGPTSGTFSREYPCCKCGKGFGNYKCTRCDCIYCWSCHKNN